MGKSKAQLQAAWAEREAEYQRMLGQGSRSDGGGPQTPAEVAEAVKQVLERRPAAQATDAKPYQVECPRCASPAGSPCLNGSGRPVRPHADRLRAAAQAGHRAPRPVLDQPQLDGR